MAATSSAATFASASTTSRSDWETLLAHNDLELHDARQDPDEIVNLAFHPEAHKAQILELNSKVNSLVDMEIGVDNGSMYPGPASQYSLG